MRCEVRQCRDTAGGLLEHKVRGGACVGEDGMASSSSSRLLEVVTCSFSNVAVSTSTGVAIVLQTIVLLQVPLPNGRMNAVVLGLLACRRPSATGGLRLITSWS